MTHIGNVIKNVSKYSFVNVIVLEDVVDVVVLEDVVDVLVLEDVVDVLVVVHVLLSSQL